MSFEDLATKKYKEQTDSKNFQKLKEECFLKFKKQGFLNLRMKNGNILMFLNF